MARLWRLNLCALRFGSTSFPSMKNPRKPIAAYAKGARVGGILPFVPEWVLAWFPDALPRSWAIIQGAYAPATDTRSTHCFAGVSASSATPITTSTAEPLKNLPVHSVSGILGASSQRRERNSTTPQTRLGYDAPTAYARPAARKPPV